MTVVRAAQDLIADLERMRDLSQSDDAEGRTIFSRLLREHAVGELPDPGKFTMSHGIIGDLDAFFFYADHDWGTHYCRLFIGDLIKALRKGLSS